MHPCPSGEERVGLGRCGFVAGRGAGRRGPHRSAPDAALPDPKKTRQGREGSALPDPFLTTEKCRRRNGAVTGTCARDRRRKAETRQNGVRFRPPRMRLTTRSPPCAPAWVGHLGLSADAGFHSDQFGNCNTAANVHRSERVAACTRRSVTARRPAGDRARVFVLRVPSPHGLRTAHQRRNIPTSPGTPPGKSMI
jgi:hypothetical protein